MTKFPIKRLRIGFVGSGFIAKFHVRSMLSVRHVDIVGVYSRSDKNRAEFCDYVNQRDLGDCKSYESLAAMLQSGNIDAIWIVAPNHARLDIMQIIHDEVVAGRSDLVAVACEKPLARTIAEGRQMLELVENAKLNHGYLENQVFCAPVLRGKEIIWRRAVPSTGRPYLARATEEHSGPHEPWFWQGDKQGGGVLSDMMCHSVEVGRHLLTEPGASRKTLKLKSVNATVANLKWTRPKYIEDLKQRFGSEVDYGNRPSGDFARGLVILEDEDGNDVLIEATTSWAYVGAGLRISLELLGPEYAMEYNSLNSGLKIFMSRAVDGDGGEGEDLVEKQNSESGLMPVIEDEESSYGYTDENRHMVQCFRNDSLPSENFHDGLAVVEILMGLYRSAELNKTINFPAPELENYVPLVARRTD